MCLNISNESHQSLLMYENQLIKIDVITMSDTMIWLTSSKTIEYLKPQRQECIYAKCIVVYDCHNQNYRVLSSKFDGCFLNEHFWCR